MKDKRAGKVHVYTRQASFNFMVTGEKIGYPSFEQLVKQHANNPTTVKRLHTNDRLPNAPTNL